MKIRTIISGLQIIWLGCVCNGQTVQGFFLDGWKHKTISTPQYLDVQQTTGPVNPACCLFYLLIFDQVSLSCTVLLNTRADSVES